MTTVDFITELFCRIDEALSEVPKHPQGHLYPSEIVTLACLFALKGVGDRAFYRWLARDYRPRLPERTRLFATHRDGTDRFPGQPTVLGVADSYGIELLHPWRERRGPKRRIARRGGRKGLSNHRWIIGGKLAVVLNQWGLVRGGAADTANVHDSAFHPVIAPFAERMIVLTAGNFARAQGNPPNLKVCARGTWNDRMLCSPCSRRCAISRRSCIASGAISRCAWPSPWPCSTCWRNGTASPWTTRAPPTSLSLSSVSKSSTTGYL